MKYLIYARVSPKGSDFEGDTSIGTQIDICRDYVVRHGSEVFDTVHDEFYSGKNLERPGISELILQLEHHTAQWDCLCVYNISRLTRNPQDMYRIMSLLASSKKRFVSCTEPDLDFSTSHGELIMGIMAHVNQYIRKVSGQNTKAKMVNIAKQGLWPAGAVPFGYCRHERKDNKLYIDPRKAEAIRDIFSSYIAGDMLKDIASRHGLSIQYILGTVLRNRVYLGLLPYDGEIYQGQHEPIIDKTLFDQAQAKLPSKKHGDGHQNRPKAQKYDYLLAGLVRCHCGRFMTPASGRNKIGKNYAYYKCTDRISCNYTVAAPKIEEKAIEYLKSDGPTPGTVKALVEKYKKRLEEYQRDIRPDLAQVSEALKKASAEREQVFNIMVSGQLNESNASFFNEKLSGLSAEVERLQSRRDYLQGQLKATGADVEEMIFAMFAQVRSIGDALEKAENRAGVRQILSMSINHIQAKESGSFEFKFTEWCSSNYKEWLPRQESNLD